MYNQPHLDIFFFTNFTPSVNMIDLVTCIRKNEIRTRIILVCNTLEYDLFTLGFCFQESLQHDLIVFPMNDAALENYSEIFFRFIRSKYFHTNSSYYGFVSNEQDLFVVLNSLFAIQKILNSKQYNYQLYSKNKKVNVFFLSSHIFYLLFHSFDSNFIFPNRINFAAMFSHWKRLDSNGNK